MTIIALPNDVPAPKFEFGQLVQWRGSSDRVEYVLVRGLQYLSLESLVGCVRA